MRILLLTLIVPLMAFCAETPKNAAPATPLPKKISVLDPVKNVSTLLPADATQRPHVLFVNVSGALPDADFREAAAYVRMKYMLNVAVRNESKPFANELVEDTAALRKRFGDKAVIVVALVKQEIGPSFVNVPGYFSQVNLRGLDKDGPEELFLKKRTRQMLLKGLAHACGIGATIDSTCVMKYNSFTLDGMDRVSTTYGPNAYFPMLELLKEIGGDSIFVLW
ncbi:MAG: hypothetical protein PF904_17725 [Kiritimatiellae bacterium]|jgi:hypothetical protein|nr:hypothetical protein [Kiritimatiellia bacterium]